MDGDTEKLLRRPGHVPFACGEGFRDARGRGALRAWLRVGSWVPGRHRQCLSQCRSRQAHPEA